MALFTMLKTFIVYKNVEKQEPKIQYISNISNPELVYGGYSSPNHLLSMERVPYYKQPSPLDLF